MYQQDLEHASDEEIINIILNNWENFRRFGPDLDFIKNPYYYSPIILELKPSIINNEAIDFVDIPYITYKCIFHIPLNQKCYIFEIIGKFKEVEVIVESGSRPIRRKAGSAL